MPKPDARFLDQLYDNLCQNNDFKDGFNRMFLMEVEKTWLNEKLYIKQIHLSLLTVKIPPSIKYLTHVDHIQFQSCKLEIPPEMGFMASHITSLIISGCSFWNSALSLPPTLSCLNPNILQMDTIGLKEVPSWLNPTEMPNLLYLNISNNKIWQLPIYIWEFPNMTDFHCENNLLNFLPLLKETKINSMYFEGNKLIRIPLESNKFDTFNINSFDRFIIDALEKMEYYTNFQSIIALFPEIAEKSAPHFLKILEACRKTQYILDFLMHHENITLDQIPPFIKYNPYLREYFYFLRNVLIEKGKTLSILNMIMGEQDLAIQMDNFVILL